MQKFKFVTDSSADLPKEVAEALDISVLPIGITFGTETYYDGVDITPAEFYEKLRNCTELPKTSQLNQYEFEELFKQYKGSGTALVVILIGSQMSATYSSAVRAAESLGMQDEVLLVDSGLVTFALGSFVIEARKLADEAADLNALRAKIEVLRPRVKLYAFVKDLKYLRYGGRLSAASMHIANMLRIHPVVTISGKVDVVSKQIGVAKCYRYIFERAKQEADLSYPVYFGNSDCPEEGRLFEERFLSEVKGAKSFGVPAQIGPTVGTHAGPGCVGVAFIAKK